MGIYVNPRNVSFRKICNSSDNPLYLHDRYTSQIMTGVPVKMAAIL